MDGVYSATLLRALVAAHLPPRLVVVGVEPSPLVRGPVVRERRARPGWFARHVLGRARVNAPDDASLVAVAHGLDLDALETSDPEALRVRAAIVGLEPDAYVVAGFPRLLGPSVLGLPRRGGLNVHPGRLPEERGPSPVFWALQRGRGELGWSIHVLERGEDSGDVTARGAIPMTPGWSGREVLGRLAQAAAPALVRAVRGLLEGDLVRHPQDPHRAARCPRPSFTDGRIDPTQRCAQIFAFVAACCEHYALYVENAGDRFYIRRALSFEPGATLPSEYLLTGELLLLAAADGLVELELKPGGVLFSATYDEEPASRFLP